MSDISNRAAYLKGLADGLKLNTESAEGQLIDGILNLLGEMAEELEMLDSEQAFLADKIDEVEEVMDMVADEVYGCDEDDEFYTLVCENCGAEIDVTGDDLDDIADGVFNCPECGEIIELDFDGCDCGCDCDCDCE